jgi:glutaredoxin
LNDHDIEHGFVDLESEDGLKIEPRLHNETKQSNPPYVYLRGEFIGGYNALNEIVRLGQLEEMTMTAEERDKSGKRTRIVISKRTEDDRPPGEGN